MFRGGQRKRVQVQIQSARVRVERRQGCRDYGRVVGFMGMQMWSLPFSPVRPPRPCCMFRVIAQTLRLSPSHRERVCVLCISNLTSILTRPLKPCFPTLNGRPRRIRPRACMPLWAIPSRAPPAHSSQLPPRLAHRHLYFCLRVVLVIQPCGPRVYGATSRTMPSHCRIHAISKSSHVTILPNGILRPRLMAVRPASPSGSLSLTWTIPSSPLLPPVPSSQLPSAAAGLPRRLPER